MECESNLKKYGPRPARRRLINQPYTTFDYCSAFAAKHEYGFCRKVGFFEQNRKTGTINSMTYRIPNSSKTNFATEPGFDTKIGRIAENV